MIDDTTMKCSATTMNFKQGKIVQWNLDLRKILGVDKIFLKSRFFLISNTGKPAKVTNKSISLQNGHMKQCKCLQFIAFVDIFTPK